MSVSQKITGGFAIVLLALALAGFMKGAPAMAMHLNDGRTAVTLAAAVWAAVACFAGRRISNVFLVSLGLLFCVDALVGLSRGMFYLSFEALNGAIAPQPASERFMAALPHLILGPIALISGVVLANSGAKGSWPK